MIYPGYQLNPGDMFQVEPDRVLYATGAPKDARERRATRKFRNQTSKPPKDHESSELSPNDDSNAPEVPETTPSSNPKETLSSLLKQARTILSDSPDTVPAKRKQELREFTRLLKRNISRPTTLTDSLEAQFLELTSKLTTSPSSTQEATQTDTPESDTPRQEEALPAALTAADRYLLRQALAEARENPIDPSKPYATPWRPRQYIAPFIFVPRYLEVHHRICSAVYLRHPVARPGLAEVPTPYPGEVNSLAYLWYLRRR